MHDRHRSIWMDPARNARHEIPSLSEHEIGHWYLATTYFNKELASALRDAACDSLSIRRQAALCATSVLLVVLTFCYIEARTPEEAWPLVGGTSLSRSEDLQWIAMITGKMSAQTLTRGLSTDPVFRHLMYVEHTDQNTFPAYLQVPGIPPESFLDLQEIVRGPEIEDLLRTADSTNFVTVIFAFWSFVGGMTADFEACLKQKQVMALLVLLYWYARLSPLPLWWLRARTLLEGRAICVYLGRYYGHNKSLVKALRWPASVLFSLTKGAF
jgi:hypothetical protein